MHLLFLTRTFPPDSGAVGHLVKELSAALTEKGYEVTVVAAGRGEQSRTGSVRVIRAGGRPFTRQSHWKRAWSYLSLYPALFLAAARQRRPDVVITTTDPPLQAVLGVLLKIRFRCRLIHWCQDLYPEMAEEAGVLKKGAAFAGLLRWISTAALRQHDRIVSIGRCMTDRLVQRGVDPEKTTQIANWTDPTSIYPVPEVENSFRKTQRLEARFVALYSGNMGLAHTFAEILDAAECLQTRAPEVMFLFIGEGPRRKAVESEATSRLLNNVRFLPSQTWETISESLSAGQVHLVSLRENLSGLVVPSKFYGGMASGRPTIFIGPPDSEVARLICEEKTGRVVAGGSSAGLVAAILEYRDHPLRLADDGERARALGLKSDLENASHNFSEIFAIG